MQSTCEQCSTVFTVLSGGKGRFCSSDCYQQWQAENGRQIKTCPTCENEFSTYRDPANARTYCSRECRPPKVEKIAKICEGCQKEFFIWPSMQAQRYCTRKCRQSHKCTITQCPNCGKDVRSWPSNQHVYCNRQCEIDYTHITKNCPVCDKVFTYHRSWPRIYCSRRCTASVNAIKNLGVEILPLMHCEQCGKEIKRNKYKDKRFCSQRCFGEWQSENIVGENHPLFKGTRPEYYGPNWRMQRRAARKRDGYKCQCCGKPQKKNGRSLDVHHIKPFREFFYAPGQNSNYLAANDLLNLVSLCASCHKLAEHGKVSFQLPLI